ncbi:MAG: GntR family transcriptional regulator [Lachnospiraceae bacterium]|nr:GntR family transcriptional regulator [Lachnospiraceae bacterium]
MIIIDYRDKRPIYEQVTDKLAQLIIKGVLSPNTKMPSVRQLAIDLSVNANTVQRAYSQLEQNGYLYSVVGKGNFVSEVNDWKNQATKENIATLRQACINAKNCGLTYDDVKKLIKEVYEEKQTS